MKSSKFNLSHYNMTTGNLGGLYPIGVVECLPGDLVSHHTNLLIRMSPLAAPVMHSITARVHHYYVPNRIVWDDEDDDNSTKDGWKAFITRGPDGLDSQTVPTLTTTGTAGDLLDYMGIPTVSGIDINALPVRAVNKIYNRYYRDQDICAERTQHDLTIPKVSWEKDYFTTARPFAQKGPSISLPVGSEAPVKLDTTVTTTTGRIVNPDGTSSNSTEGLNKHNTANADILFGATSTNPMKYDPGDTLIADLALATGADVIAFREALAMQRFQEMRARYGSRYEEYMAHLGSTYRDEDSEPVYLGGGQQQVNFSEVLQTANDSSDRAYGVGDMYGHGVSAMRSNRYVKRIQEHGHIISLLSVRPKAIYTEGIHRNWLREDPEDYHTKELEFIGQQEVYDAEVFAVNNASKSSVFGYQDRYREYKEVPSYVSGEFRTSALDYWHLGRQLGSAPTLNQDFLDIDGADHARIFNEQTQDQMWITAHHNMVARRMVSKKATPRII